jgi:hypothetical protein
MAVLSGGSSRVVVGNRRALPGWGILPIPELSKSTTFVCRIRCGRVRRFLLSCPLEPSTALPQGSEGAWSKHIFAAV